MAKEKVQVVEFRPIEPKTVTVTIVGDSDLILNKMNDVTTRQLTDARKDKAKDLTKPNEWEEIITAMHWLNGKPDVFSEDTLRENLDPDVNAPCITAFGLKKSFGEAVTRITLFLLLSRNIILTKSSCHLRRAPRSSLS